MSCLEGFGQTCLLSFPIRCEKDKGILGWRIYLHLKHGKLIHCLLNVLAITRVLFYLKAACQSVRWKEREYQGRPWCGKAGRLPGAFVTISKWVWGFTGLHVFLVCVGEIWTLALFAWCKLLRFQGSTAAQEGPLAQRYKIPGERQWVNITFAHFP